MEKLDLKKQLKHLYSPSAKEVVLVDVPEMKFVVVDGRIEPGESPGTSPAFSQAIGALYGLAYTLKFMSKKREVDPIDYKVMALEGLWTTPAGGEDYATATEWLWTLMIMQPGHIADEMFAQAVAELKVKRAKQAAKDGQDPEAVVAWLDRARLEALHEGLSVQIMHVGPYSKEPATMVKMSEFAAENGYEFRGLHHEIYLGDPRTAKPENLKTILRHQVVKSA